eukprot:COSAG01_NODE_2255_length_8070_cov_25.147786_4_plen_110_part_00
MLARERATLMRCVSCVSCADGGIFPSEIPLNLTKSQRIGPAFKSMFSSESPGATCYSSFESMAPTLAEEHWGVHGGAQPDSCGRRHECTGTNVMAQRTISGAHAPPSEV